LTDGSLPDDDKLARRIVLKAASCEAATAVCPRCSSKKHEYASCPVDKKHAKCANCGENHNAAYKGCIKYKTIDRALNISVKQGISYRDAVTQVKKTYTEEKTRSTSTSSDITQQMERVQGAKKATTAVADGTKTMKLSARKNADRTNDKPRKETSAKATPTSVSEANKSTSGHTSSPPTAGAIRYEKIKCCV